MKISKKALVAIICILLAILLGETYICRSKIKETAIYYKNKIVSSYKDYKNHKEAQKNLKKFLDAELPAKSVAIFEPNSYHLECMPGYAKYFTDLGYSVDILMRSDNEDSMELFEPKEKIRIFSFKKLEQISSVSSQMSDKFSKYDHVLLHTTDPDKKSLIDSLGFFSNTNTFFIAHDVTYPAAIGYEDYLSQNKFWVLGDFEKGLYVNPHYFGDVQFKNKNEKTRFFITSTTQRSYEVLIDAVTNLHNAGLDFEIFVCGRSYDLCKEAMPENIRNHFSFHQQIPYSTLYSEIQKSDYIIMLLDPENDYDKLFKGKRATGSAQLVYGFAKPPIIHKDFADMYKFDSDNAWIYNSNKNLTAAMKNAINEKSDNYEMRCAHVKLLASDIYSTSLNHVKKALHMA